MKVLIVDDEIIIREGLRNLINWEKNGFEQFEEAENAIDAIEKIGQQKPDLIITDIFMPEMSGIEFAKKIKKEFPEIRFIIVTGYEKFEYAKEAIEIGVAKYLIKPIFPEELQQVVEEVNQEIVEERKKLDWGEFVKKRLNEYRPIIIEKFWTDIVSGDLTDNHEISDRATLVEIDITQNYLLCLALKINLKNNAIKFGDSQGSITKFAIRNITEEILRGELIYIVESSKSTLCCILKSEVNYKKIKLLQSKIVELTDLHVTFGIGRNCEHVSKIHLSANDAIEVANTLMVNGGDMAKYQELLSWKNDSFIYPYPEEKELIEMLRYQDKIDSRTFLSFMQAIKKQNISTEMVKLIFYQLLIAIYRLANEFDIHSVPPFHESYAKLNELESIHEIQGFFEKLFDEIMQSKALQHSSYVERLVEKAAILINERYKDSTLSVKEIASKLHLTPNYFSRIFTQEMAITCVEYITKKRLEEAKKRLILSTIKNYEIAEQVGYSNPHYFSYLFKKNTGMSPSEYRERNKQ